MVTLFSIPKPFVDPHIALIQRNAIESWLALDGPREVILYGDDPGVGTTADDLGIQHVADVERTEYGTPLLSWVFRHVQQHAQFGVVCYLNCDIILLSNLRDLVSSLRSDNFLAAGQRWDLDVRRSIDFAAPNWRRQLWRCVEQSGRRHPPDGMDYFLFPRGCFADIPPFAVGRPGWDNWLIYHARSRGIPVIDASRTIRVVHQKHDYRHVPLGRSPSNWEGPEGDRNRALIGDMTRLFTLHHATHLACGRMMMPALFPPHVQYRWRSLSVLHPWFAFLMGVIRGTLHRVRQLIGREP